MSEDPDGEVLDMGRPLRCQLEELDVVPLNAVNGHYGAENTIKAWPSSLAPQFGRTEAYPSAWSAVAWQCR